MSPDRSGPRPGAGAADHTSVLELAPLATAASCARLHAINVLHEWGLGGLSDDAAMTVSELVTNAVNASTDLPGHPPVTLLLTASRTALRVEVADQRPLEPEPRDAAADDEGGRGLTVVAALSIRWGCERTGRQRKVVWAELAL
jgi:anti-sigma regulatory factor (Ser/Thr protein kinase)